MPAVRAAAVALAAVASLLAAGPAHAADWRTLFDTNSRQRESPVLVGDRDGAALMAWVEFPADRPGVPNDPNGPGVLKVVTRPAGGAVGPVRYLTPPGAHPRSLSGSGDGHGGVILAWRNGTLPQSGMRVSFSSIANGLREPERVTGVGELPRSPAQLGGSPAARPAVALAARGDGVVAWLARGPEGCGYTVRAAVRAPGHGLGSGKRISSGCAHAWNPRVSLNSDGVGAVAWDQGASCPAARNPCEHTVMVARVVRGVFRPAAAATRHASPHAPAVLGTPDGTLVAWRALTGHDDAGLRGRVMASRVDAWGHPGTATALSRNDRISGTPRLAVGADRTVAAAWATGNVLTGRGPFQIAVRPPAHKAFGAPLTLPALGGSTGSLQVAVDGAGAVAVLHCSSTRLRLNARTAAGVLTPSELVGDSFLSQGPCLGPAEASAQLAVSRTGVAQVALPFSQVGRIALLERAAPLG